MKFVCAASKCFAFSFVLLWIYCSLWHFLYAFDTRLEKWSVNRCKSGKKVVTFRKSTLTQVRYHIKFSIFFACFLLNESQANNQINWDPWFLIALDLSLYVLFVLRRNCILFSRSFATLQPHKRAYFSLNRWHWRQWSSYPDVFRRKLKKENIWKYVIKYAKIPYFYIYFVLWDFNAHIDMDQHSTLFFAIR